jgi:hypothetical protein
MLNNSMQCKGHEDAKVAEMTDAVLAHATLLSCKLAHWKQIYNLPKNYSFALFALDDMFL